MGYFSNSTEAEFYRENYCDKCIHGDNCAVLDAHWLYGYRDCNDEKSILHLLIPITPDGIGNAECKMYREKEAA